MTSTGITDTKQVQDIRQSVIEIAQAVLERDDIEPSAELFDHGVTSLAFIRIVARLNEKYGISLDVAELEEASMDCLSILVKDTVGSRP